MEYYKFIKTIGKGAYGSVNLVQSLLDKEFYTMKVIKLSYLNRPILIDCRYLKNE